MKARWLVVIILVLFVRGVLADGEPHASAPKMKETLQTVISGQLAAFRAGDFTAAYAFADPEIKALYPVEAFEQMVRTSYPAIANSAAAAFGLAFDNGDDAVVNVSVTGPDKLTRDYQYVLKRDGETWHICGVALLAKQSIQV